MTPDEDICQSLQCLLPVYEFRCLHGGVGRSALPVVCWPVNREVLTTPVSRSLVVRASVRGAGWRSSIPDRPTPNVLSINELGNRLASSESYYGLRVGGLAQKKNDGHPNKTSKLAHYTHTHIYLHSNKKGVCRRHGLIMQQATQ